MDRVGLSLFFTKTNAIEHSSNFKQPINSLQKLSADEVNLIIDYLTYSEQIRAALASKQLHSVVNKNSFFLNQKIEKHSNLKFKIDLQIKDENQFLYKTNQYYAASKRSTVALVSPFGAMGGGICVQILNMYSRYATRRIIRELTIKSDAVQSVLLGLENTPKKI
ncbi:MAG: hypothetical protein WCF91_03800 [bacterium]